MVFLANLIDGGILFGCGVLLWRRRGHPWRREDTHRAPATV